MKKGFFSKFGKWLVCIFIITLVISYLVFAFDGFIPTGDVNKGDWLSFWGGFLAFYGATFLGFVVIWQNANANEQTLKANEQTDRANDISKGLLRIEELRLYSNVVLDKGIQGTKTIPLSNENLTCNDNKDELCFSIHNRGDAILQQIEIVFSENYIFRSHLTLVNGDFKNVKIKIPSNITTDQKVNIAFISCYNKKTYGDFSVVYEHNKPKMMYYHYHGISDMDTMSYGVFST